ncbi:hypothetical protein ANO11243_072720 [Dothideomycetidae sp. 11243]|nr:hypothetical protein ANO11243_072720 [fungal sp. No.11243]
MTTAEDLTLVFKQIDENGNAIMTPCDNTTTSLTWCCGYNVTDCCGKGAPAEVTLQPTLIGFVSATDIVSSSPTASSTNSTSSASPSSSSQPSSGLSSGAKAGIGVGVALGVVAAIAIAIIAVFSRRRSRARSQTPYEPVHNDSGGYADYKTGIPTEPRANQNDIELDAQGDGDVAEMDDQRAPVELEGNMPEQEVKKPDGIVHTGP